MSGGRWATRRLTRNTMAINNPATTAAADVAEHPSAQLQAKQRHEAFNKHNDHDKLPRKPFKGGRT